MNESVLYGIRSELIRQLDALLTEILRVLFYNNHLLVGVILASGKPRSMPLCR